jgi:hypothetical protein
MGVFKCNVGLIWSLLFAVLITVIPRYWELKIESIQPLPSAAASVPKTEVVEDTIQKNTTLVATLVDYNIPADMANQVADLIKPVFDVRKLASEIRSGSRRKLTALLGPSNTKSTTKASSRSAGSRIPTQRRSKSWHWKRASWLSRRK